jgi:hypothetical protein
LQDPEGKFARESDLSSLRALFVAGERADPSTVAHFEKLLGVPVVDHWWQTESGSPMCGFQDKDIGTVPGSCGRPLPGFNVRVLCPEVRIYVPMSYCLSSMVLGRHYHSHVDHFYFWYFVCRYEWNRALLAVISRTHPPPQASITSKQAPHCPLTKLNCHSHHCWPTHRACVTPPATTTTLSWPHDHDHDHGHGHGHDRLAKR